MSLSERSSAFDSETFGQDASFHLEQPVGSMTISPSGRDVALASKEGLHVIDLDSPYSPPRYLPHRTPWEVADVQWSPFAVRDYWVVSTSNQKALVWNLGAKSWQDTIELVLHAHTRAITDINFSAHDPDMLATCAVDSFVHCWDLRVPSRPAFSVSDWFAGATQVKWSRKDEHVLASSHDKFLHIWDTRHGAIPVRTIEAHGTKIYGVDWNRFEPHKVVTCSLDRTIKFWNTRTPNDEPERIIETPFPVWRARHTPFGWGMIAMPQRGSSDLFLYDRRPIDGFLESGHVRPVARYPGHAGQVKEFLWRARGSVDEIDHRDFQLISWGTDKELRLHRIDTGALEGIGYEKGVSKTRRLNFTRKGARYKTFRDQPDDVSSPIEASSRGESLPSQQQILSFRKRTSTAVGMSKVPVSQLRGWGTDRRTSRVAMHGRGTHHNEINAIAWLKNVKIATWDPDTLAEEIRQVGEKFKKVDFETVDIKRRKLVMSLQAPWKEHENSIYLRVDIRFPKAYPKAANAIISLQKTGAIEDELHDTLSKELHTIAEVYSSQRRGCLEAVLRYVLREQSLEQIVTWVMGESVADSKMIDPELLPRDDSSDSDDDNLQGLGNALASSANGRVPLAKGCGALWSENGTLVCFFPPKQKEADSVFGTLSVQDIERSESNRLFEGFGRIHTSSSRKPTNGTKTTNDDSDSESSDSLTGSSSSSSSSSSEPATDLQGGILPYLKTVSGLALQRSRSIDFSNRSTTMAGAKTTEGPRKSILSLKRYDDLLLSTEELAKEYRILGSGQEVCRHNADAASKQGRDDLSSVWTLAGMILSKTIPIEITKHPTDDLRDDILVIARRATSRLRPKDSGIGLHDGKKKYAALQIGLAQVRWGNSPLAATYLIPAMFDYYDRIGDVQMLAMLSCIFANPSISDSPNAAAALQPLPTLHSNSHRTPRQYYSSKAVAESLLMPPLNTNYVWIPPIDQARVPRLLSSSDEQAVLRSRRATNVSLDLSGDHRYEPSSGRWSRAPSMVGEDGQNQPSRSSAGSLSTSPEGNRMTHRAITGGNLSTAQASLSALTQSFSHSPPIPSNMSGLASSVKKYSPSSSLTPSWGLFSGGHGSRVSRSSVHYSESSSHDKEDIRSSASTVNLGSFRRDGRLTPDTGRQSLRSVAPSEASDTTRRIEPTKRRKTLKTTLRNQDKFDLDNHVSLPCLNPQLAERYKGYRVSYAHLLDVWQLPIQCAEVLKIDGATDDEVFAPSPIKRPRRKTLVSDDQYDIRGLQICRTCQSCGSTLAAIEKNGMAIGWHCINANCISNVASRRNSRRSRCTICETAVYGLSVPCLRCGHLTCYDCAEEWFGNKEAIIETQQKRIRSYSIESVALETIESGEAAIADDDEIGDEHRQCPSGCGCPCGSVQIDVPIPSLSSKRTSQEISNPLPLVRTTSQLSTTSQTPTLMSANSTDTALASFLALTRRKSATAEAVGTKTGPAVEHSPSKAEPVASETTAQAQGEGVEDNNGDRLLNPWAGSKFASLGRGMGGGLSRGLRERGSDSTIRRIG